MDAQIIQNILRAKKLEADACDGSWNNVMIQPCKSEFDDSKSINCFMIHEEVYELKYFYYVESAILLQ